MHSPAADPVIDCSGNERAAIGNPRSETRPAHGYLLQKLEGRDALQGAQDFQTVIDAVKSRDPDIRKTANVALKALRQTASAINGNPLVDQIQDAFLTAATGERDTDKPKGDRK